MKKQLLLLTLLSFTCLQQAPAMKPKQLTKQVLKSRIDRELNQIIEEWTPQNNKLATELVVRKIAHELASNLGSALLFGKDNTRMFNEQSMKLLKKIKTDPAGNFDTHIQQIIQNLVKKYTRAFKGISDALLIQERNTLYRTDTGYNEDRVELFIPPLIQQFIKGLSPETTRQDNPLVSNLVTKLVCRKYLRQLIQEIFPRFAKLVVQPCTQQHTQKLITQIVKKGFLEGVCYGVRAKDVNLVELCLKLIGDGDMGAITNGDGQLVSTLQYATQHRTLKIVMVLIEAGCTVNIQDKNGKTELHQAALHGDIEMVKVLLGAGSDPNMLDNDFKTPADYACNNEVKALLMQHVAPHVTHDTDGNDRTISQRSGYPLELTVYKTTINVRLF